MTRLFSKELSFKYLFHHFSNIVRNTSWMYVFIFMGALICSSGQAAGAAAAAASMSEFEEGVKAFKIGNYTAAKDIFGNVVAAGEEERETNLSRAYLLAMNDTLTKVPPTILTLIQAESSKGDPIFQVLEGRLHLAKLHPASNPDIGIKLIKMAAVEDVGYAYYTWGLYFEGKFGGAKDLKQAGLKYQFAKELGFREAFGRIGDLRRELDKLEAAAGGAWDGTSTWDDVLDMGDGKSVLRMGTQYTKGPKGPGGAGGGAGAPPSEWGEELDRPVGSSGLEGGSAYTKPVAPTPYVSGGGAAGGAGTRGTDEDRSTVTGEDARTTVSGGVDKGGTTASRAPDPTSPSSGSLMAAAAGGAGISSVTVAAVAVGGAGSGGGSSAAALVTVPRVPAIAVGHEDLYRRFLDGRLQYRPKRDSDGGLITLPFRDILGPIAKTSNPLSATFDLSRCGKARQCLSINIGYKKARIPANNKKTEIWICPKFLVERELDTFKIGGGLFTSPKHPFANIMDKWEAPVGYFWTWGGYDVKSDNYDYLLNGTGTSFDESLYGKYKKASHTIVSPSAMVWVVDEITEPCKFKIFI